MTEGQKSKYLQGAQLAQNFGLELLESILTSHIDILSSHPEMIQILRVRTMPLLIRTLSEKASFSLTVRIMRILQLISSHLLLALASECEVALSLLNHMLDPDAAVTWKRVLCIEVFRGIHLDATLVRSIYAHFDEQQERRSIIRDHLGCLVRLASEKPNVIGLGSQSSVPTVQNDESGDQAAIQAGGFIGTIGASVNTIDTNNPGISNRWSILRNPCIDMLDKNEPPLLPATYIYSIALSCVTTFSEGLARFLLPFTVPLDGKSKRRSTKTSQVDRSSSSTEKEWSPADSNLIQARKTPTNPLSLRDHPLYDQISTSANMVDQCWPALLATSSTFLNASMDSEHFHTLIRAFQKFTQISGLLDLRTPRDAFLTTLGKHAIPSSTNAKSTKGPLTPLMSSSEDKIDRNGATTEQSAVQRPAVKRKPSLDTISPSLNSRHLLCLRALINLGIALGPFLQDSWSIVFETLQQADLVNSLSRSGQPSLVRRRSDITSGTDGADGGEDLALEMAAAATAAQRLLESSTELPPESFLDLLQCLCSLLPAETQETSDAKSPSISLSPENASRKHQKLRSISGTLAESSAANRESIFILENLNQVIRHNISRLAQRDAYESGWDLLLKELKNMISRQNTPSDLRLRASTTLHEMVARVCAYESSETLSAAESLRTRALEAIVEEVDSLNSVDPTQPKAVAMCNLEIHAQALEATVTVLEKCGESLTGGWDRVFMMVNSIFNSSQGDQCRLRAQRPKSAKLVRSSFGSIQLICSDFLTSIPSAELLKLIDTLVIFSAQDLDLNIALTTTTLFRNIAEFLVRDIKHLDYSGLWTTLQQTKINSEEIEFSLKRKDSLDSLWLYLLCRTVRLSVDERQEVRHGVLRTIFGILESASDKIGESSTCLCFRLIILHCITENEKNFANANQGLERHSWNQTAVLIIQGSCNTFSQWLDVCTDAPTIQQMFSELLPIFETILQRKDLDVSKAVFAGLSKILLGFEDSITIGEPAISACWEKWLTANPGLHTDGETDEGDNQGAILAYLDCLGQILRLTAEEARLDHILATLTELRSVITLSSSSIYSSDIDQLSPVQKAVTEVLKRMPTMHAEALLGVLDCIATLINLAYTPDEVQTGSAKTYLALSKTAMTLAESFLAHHLQMATVKPQRLVGTILRALQKPVQLKYHCRPEGRPPPPWRKATSAAVNILEKSRNFVSIGTKVDEWQIALWRIIVSFTDAVLGADTEDVSDGTVLASDQDADIEAFLRIRDTLIPALGSPDLPDDLRTEYAGLICRHSLIHEPHPDDFARSGQGLLDGLKTDHIGRVQDLPPSPRSKLGYLLLDELFALTKAEDRKIESNNLAKAIRPYLVLRVGLTLKAYVYDQPLRGLMPQPWSQKGELTYVLGKVIEMHTKAQVAGHTASDGETLLFSLYPLLLRAQRAARNDQRVMTLISDVLESLEPGVVF